MLHLNIFWTVRGGKKAWSAVDSGLEETRGIYCTKLAHFTDSELRSKLGATPHQLGQRKHCNAQIQIWIERGRFSMLSV